MIEGMKVLGLITARGGSKRVPLKNIRQVISRPLIQYTIEAGIGSRYIDELIVSTDSVDIADIALNLGARVPFMRPSYLATDEARSIDVVTHAIAQMSQQGEDFDVVVLLQPTSPLRLSADIDGALETFVNHGCRPVTSISEVTESPILYRSLELDGTLKPLLQQGSTIRKQDMPMFYKVNGAVYVNKCNEVTSDTSLNDNPIGYLMPSSRSLDIDELSDFEKAEKILSQMSNLDSVSD